MKKIALFIIVFFVLTGCGSNDSKNNTNNIIDKNSKKHFGTLSNATVNIYELGKSKKLLFSEKTSTGKIVDNIGNFNAHTDSFDSKKFYLYEVSGGENWDIDKDEKVDKTSTVNKMFYRAIYKGNKSHVAWWSVVSRN